MQSPARFQELLPVRKMLPHSATSGATPSPRKLNYLLLIQPHLYLMKNVQS